MTIRKVSSERGSDVVPLDRYRSAGIQFAAFHLEMGNAIQTPRFSG
jgi:hypothetical protein